MPTNSDYGNVRDLVMVKEIHDDVVVMKSGGLRQILMVGGVNFALKSEEEQNIITQGYQNFLNSVNFPIQIIVHSRKIDIEQYLSHMDALRDREESSLLQSQIAEYQEFVRGFVKDNPIMAKTFFVVVPYVPVAAQVAQAGSGILDSLPLVGNKQKSPEVQKKTQEERAVADKTTFDEAVMQLKQRVAQVAQGFSSVGLESVILNDEQLVELFYNFYNPETIEKKGEAPPKKKK